MPSKQILKAMAAVEQAEARLKQVVFDAQSNCTHPDVGEADYGGSGLPPFRVCLHCGMTEDGWGPGYQVLKFEHPRKFGRKELYDMRHGLHIQDHHKGVLIRKERTVQDLLVCDKDLPY